MIVSCANCSTKYNLPDDKIPAEGIKVKCSKCSHIFKVAPPAATPEEEVEVLLDENDDTRPDPAQDRSSDFDAAFEEAVAGGGMDDDEDAAGGDDAGDEDFGDDLADMFGDDPVDAGGSDDDSDGDEDDFGDLDFGDGEPDAEEPAGESEADGLDDEDDFGLDDDDDDDGQSEPGASLDLGDGEGGLFASLDGEDGKKGRKKGGLGKLLLTLLLLLLLIVVAAVVTLNMRLWSMPQSMQDMAIELPFELPLQVPFLKGPGEQTADVAPAEEPAAEPAVPAGDPMENIKKIQPVDFRQYVINNEIEGRVFVVEGKALNNSETPKEQIKVEVALFAADGTEMAKQELLCGNTLSLFQLQVDDRRTIEENLTSERGTSLNNSYIKPGETTPFMFVFFGLENKVEEYRISVTGALEPQR